jgi:nucleoside 2-deoxyribosyltransferase
VKIYIAGWFGSQKRLQKEKHWLEQRGHVVTSSWLNEKVDDPTKITTTDLLPESNQLLAAKDFWEIAESELFVIDTGDVSDRGGREVELGYALALKIPVVLVGPRRNVFHYLIRKVYAEWHDFVIWEKL